MIGPNKLMMAVRDLLLPGLHMASKDGHEFDIILNHRDGILKILGVKGARRAERQITQAEVEDGSYKEKFRPLIAGMKRELDTPR